MTATGLRVAIAEDSAILRDGLVQLLVDRGFTITGAVGDPVLEQITDPGGVVGQQVGRIAGLHVLREEEDPEALVTVA